MTKRIVIRAYKDKTCRLSTVWKLPNGAHISFDDTPPDDRQECIKLASNLTRMIEAHIEPDYGSLGYNEMTDICIKAMKGDEVYCFSCEIKE